MTVRWGICGTGRIAERFVGQLAEIDDAEVVAVASRTPSRAAEFAASNDIGSAHGDYEGLASDEAVDIVYVANTQEGHHSAVISMLRGGRHVLCEKPLAMSEAQVASMIGVAAAERRFLMEAMWSRFSDAWRRVSSLVEQGRIGEVLQVRADLSVVVPPDARLEHRLWDPDRGGGALLDVGVYPLNLACFLLGHPERVQATGVLAASGVDRRVAALLDHPGGRTSIITTGIDVDSGKQARISGTEGSITIEAPMHIPTTLVLERAGVTELIECEKPGLGVQVPEVHRCLREGLLESPVMDWSESRSLHRTTDEIRRQIGLRYPWE